MNFQRMLGLLTLNLIAITASQAGDAAKGQLLSSACAECHGKYGLSSKETYPNIAGQKQAYIIKALQQYKSGQRSDTTMQAMVGPLSAEDIDNLATYFSGNAIIPSYATDTGILHIPYIGVAGASYQGDLQYLQGSSFDLISIKPLQ
ncbi:MAG: cytochrome c [Methylococcaceae bacterium]